MMRLGFNLANDQGAKSWALRAAMSLFELLHMEGRDQEGRALLAESYGQFAEGFQTYDLRRARALLEI